MGLNEALGTQLRVIIAKKGVTKRAVANYLKSKTGHFSDAKISLTLSGKRIMTAEELYHICKFLGISADEVFNSIEEE